MRHDQMIKLIQKECAYLDNISILRSQQARIRLDSMISAMCEPKVLLKALFKPESFYDKVEEIYAVKSKAFNEDLKEKLNREKLKI